ncbi:MAG: elongation factor P [Bacteroidetes bacterium GWE2_41_25]|nr:MAG: elongation factor P [Bacteroidetes bacterium GWA2_40_15]OFX89337.1 MAG: elongation factor P [Bacteroidetes bacterium GWC2_40_22]OFY03220.1 MAG: elongation factor P [Bacteroidetes bacterium GWE2_41_25]OFY58165.1 MAG: elongation factor P [Bacteroidetes bacterium GWF2_41_9]HBH84482.1 elongation factor P [Bacteroidales bacterium]
MASTADFRNGLVIEYNNDLYTIVQFQHVKPGKGPAFVRTKLKSLKTGRVIDNTFSSGVKVNVARVERRPYQYLYKDDMGYYFMHLETFEQIHVQDSMIENPEFLIEGVGVEVVVHAETETVLTVDLPQFVVLEVVYSEPGLRGDTATNTLKQAKVENGSVIMVPLFVNTGDKIKIDTRDRSYVERVKT